MAGRGTRRTTFDKLQRERARREKQAAKRARRQGTSIEPPLTSDAPPMDGLVMDGLPADGQDATPGDTTPAEVSADAPAGRTDEPG